MGVTLDNLTDRAIHFTLYITLLTSVGVTWWIIIQALKGLL